MRKIISIIWILLVFVVSQAQVTTSPTVVASGGGYATGSNIAVSYTIGESVINTATGTGSILTQGFQQPNEIINAILETEEDDAKAIALYPVPANSTMWCGYRFATPGKVTIEARNVLGQVVGPSLADTYSSGNQVQQIDISQMAVGNYYLTVIHTSETSKKTTVTKLFYIAH